ncbi:ArsR/SmtB family transcription factor [Sphaerisporangium perillae]|uniref:ArsR/SmtB family transcription factor n=1 Tax=Sphaerisporangium perillae TaxID=2935860 RepID=UPI00200C6798|nr:metalloregulator ArsR/SmtB family transcription factor [Sphaerisporangium perillae]
MVTELFPQPFLGHPRSTRWRTSKDVRLGDLLFGVGHRLDTKLELLEDPLVVAGDLFGPAYRLHSLHFIEYRRLSMEDITPLDRDSAEEYASWFRALADATRIQIVSLLARHREPMTVGEIVTAVQIGQSTVSHHLKILSEVRFVLVQRRGTASLYRINETCVDCFPTAADVVMGRPVPATPICE